jgi:hypothetical protein
MSVKVRGPAAPHDMRFSVGEAHREKLALTAIVIDLDDLEANNDLPS